MSDGEAGVGSGRALSQPPFDYLLLVAAPKVLDKATYTRGYFGSQFQGPVGHVREGLDIGA